MLLVIQIGVIGNEHIVVGHLFNNGVPAVSDIDYALFIQDRADIVISLRNKCKGGKDIQAGNCFAVALDTFDLRGNLFRTLQNLIHIPVPSACLRHSKSYPQVLLTVAWNNAPHLSASAYAHNRPAPYPYRN